MLDFGLNFEFGIGKPWYLLLLAVRSAHLDLELPVAFGLGWLSAAGLPYFFELL